MKKVQLFFSLVLIIIVSCTQVQNEKNLVVMTTSYGEIRIKLYDKTRKHKLNFIKLAKEGYFDNMSFHRIIKEFMIQTGDPNSKDDSQVWGSGGPNYVIDPEIFPEYFHKKGAISAARLPDSEIEKKQDSPNYGKLIPINPMRHSSGSQFFIVQGRKFTNEELDEIEKSIERDEYQHFAYLFMMRPETEWIRKLEYEKLEKNNPDSLQKLNKIVSQQIDEVYKKEKKTFKFTKEQRKIYTEVGGYPFLDMSYTVFGEVVSGLEIIDKIASVETHQNDRPVKPVKITVKIIE